MKNWTIRFGKPEYRFWQFQDNIKEEAKLGSLKIQTFLKHGKGKERHQGANPCFDDQI
jgi:hypothetical protein